MSVWDVLTKKRQQAEETVARKLQRLIEKHNAGGLGEKDADDLDEVMTAYELTREQFIARCELEVERVKKEAVVAERAEREAALKAATQALDALDRTEMERAKAAQIERERLQRERGKAAARLGAVGDAEKWLRDHVPGSPYISALDRDRQIADLRTRLTDAERKVKNCRDSIAATEQNAAARLPDGPGLNDPEMIIRELSGALRDAEQFRDGLLEQLETLECEGDVAAEGLTEDETEDETEPVVAAQ